MEEENWILDEASGGLAMRELDIERAYSTSTEVDV